MTLPTINYSEFGPTYMNTWIQQHNTCLDGLSAAMMGAERTRFDLGVTQASMKRHEAAVTLAGLDGKNEAERQADKLARLYENPDYNALLEQVQRLQHDLAEAQVQVEIYRAEASMIRALVHALAPPR